MPFKIIGGILCVFLNWNAKSLRHLYLEIRRAQLAAIMHDVAHFCRSVERACVGGPTCWIGLRQLAVRRVWVDLPRWRLIGAHGPAAHGPDRMRPRATVRNNVPSGQLVGSWTRMRAMCSITRAPILIRRSRIVTNSQRASGLVRGIAARTPCISQNAAV